MMIYRKSTLRLALSFSNYKIDVTFLLRSFCKQSKWIVQVAKRISKQKDVNVNNCQQLSIIMLAI